MKYLHQFIIVLLLSSVSLLGQTKSTKQADTYFNNLSYASAALAYQTLSLEAATAHVLQRLGDSYYFNSNMQEASIAYGRLFKDFPGQSSEYVFRYAQSLRGVGNYKDSDALMAEFSALEKNDSRGVHFTASEVSLEDLLEGNPAYVVSNLRSVNTVNSDFGVTDFGSSILFSSPRKRNSFIKLSHTQNNKNFLDIFTVKKVDLSVDQVSQTLSRSMFSKEINSKYHESSVTFSPDKHTMYFTRNNYNKGVYKKDTQGYNNLKIFKAVLVNGVWGNVTEVPFNSNEYSVGHPSLSSDGRYLYFASDMPGGFGGTDLYVTEVHLDGSFGTVKNLGNIVNTEGREMFPFIGSNDILYFSSDGHFGLGALDVFSTFKEGDSYRKPLNLKTPVNSNLDDFAFSINPTTKEGYLSSNREGGVGDDDIYQVLALEEVTPESSVCKEVVSGFVKDKKFSNPLSDAVVSITDSTGVVVKTILSNPFGEFRVDLPCDQSYTVRASKEYYVPDTTSFTTPRASVVNLVLSTVEELSYNTQDELVIKIDPIYFDYNKSSIRPDAELVLDHVVAVLTKYPKINIHANSHTDARGGADYNKRLSERRAQSTAEYIISKGINPNRIVYKGFGESQLTNGCEDNSGNKVKCTDEEHDRNRRTEFVIDKM